MQIPSQTSIKCSQLSAVPENPVDENEEVAVCLCKNTGDPHHSRGGKGDEPRTLSHLCSCQMTGLGKGDSLFLLFVNIII